MRLIPVGAVVSAFLVALTGTAGAAASTASEPVTTTAFECSTGWFCTWDRADGTGSPRMSFQHGARDLSEVGYNDRISSVNNRSGRIMCLYEHARGEGRSLPIAAGWSGPIGPRYNFDNITSSVGLYNTALRRCDGIVPGEG